MLPYCDLVIVADDARLRLPFVPLGVVPEAGSSYTIPAILGRQVASYYLLTGDWLDGPGAVAAGLALRCVPSRRPDGRGRGHRPPPGRAVAASLAATKRLIRAGMARRRAGGSGPGGGGVHDPPRPRGSKDALDQFVSKSVSAGVGAPPSATTIRSASKDAANQESSWEA